MNSAPFTPIAVTKPDATLADYHKRYTARPGDTVERFAKYESFLAANPQPLGDYDGDGTDIYSGWYARLAAHMTAGEPPVKPRAAKRIEFEATKWVLAGDGLWANTNADSTCPTCRGHGVVDIGDYGCILDHCPTCWTEHVDAEWFADMALCDRADMVEGHFCIGRHIAAYAHLPTPTWEFWTEKGWGSAGTVIVGRAEAVKIRLQLATTVAETRRIGEVANALSHMIAGQREKTAFELGIEAAEASVRKEKIECPFKPDTREYNDWHRAYRDFWDY